MNRSVKKYLSILMLLAFPLPYLAATTDDFATIQGDARGIFWLINPGTQYKSIKLTLSRNCAGAVGCNGAVKTTVFNDTPSTEPLSDGSYNYELQITPLIDESVRARLQQLRQQGDNYALAEEVSALKAQGAIPQQAQTQSGYFSILDGQLIISTAIEEE